MAKPVFLRHRPNFVTIYFIENLNRNQIVCLYVRARMRAFSLLLDLSADRARDMCTCTNTCMCTYLDTVLRT